MFGVQQLSITRGAYVEYGDGYSLSICYVLNDVDVGGAKSHPLRLTIDYDAKPGTKADTALGPYSIRLRVGTVAEDADIAVEIQRPGMKPLRFYLERDFFGLKLLEMEGEVSEVNGSEGDPPPT